MGAGTLLCSIFVAPEPQTLSVVSSELDTQTKFLKFICCYYFIFSFYFMCRSILPACMLIYHVHFCISGLSLCSRKNASDTLEVGHGWL